MRWLDEPQTKLNTTTESPPTNFGVKLMRPGFGPAAELPALSPAGGRHGGCRSPLGSANVIGGNRRAAQASARGTGRTAYTKDVSRTKKHGKPSAAILPPFLDESRAECAYFCRVVLMVVGKTES